MIIPPFPVRKKRRDHPKIWLSFKLPLLYHTNLILTTMDKINIYDEQEVSLKPMSNSPICYTPYIKKEMNITMVI